MWICCRTANRCKLLASRFQEATQDSNAMGFQSEIKAERVVSIHLRRSILSNVGRAAGHVHPVRQFALCIWQAPRLAATFGSFWSLQKEPAGGREFGEM